MVLDLSKLVVTADDSLTLKDAETDELYHNSAGAYTEAFVSYFQFSNAQAHLSQFQTLSLLDACFGLGYNTWVLLSELSKCASGRVAVTGLETDPHVLSYIPHILQDRRFNELRGAIGRLPDGFGRWEFLLGGLSVALEIAKQDLRRALPTLRDNFDLVFHDPFSPRKVPELWSLELFLEYRRLLDNRRGRLLTYSSAGAVRGGLMSAGFKVYETAPLGRKRSSTLASPADVTGGVPLSPEELRRLKGPSGVPYRDPGLSSPRGDILRARDHEQKALSPLKD